MRGGKDLAKNFGGFIEKNHPDHLGQKTQNQSTRVGAKNCSASRPNRDCRKNRNCWSWIYQYHTKKPIYCRLPKALLGCGRYSAKKYSYRLLRTKPRQRNAHRASANYDDWRCCGCGNSTTWQPMCRPKLGERGNLITC